MNMTSVSTSGGVKVVKLVRVCGARMRTTSRASCSFNTSLSTPLTTQALDLRVKRVANTSGRTRCVTRALFGGGTMEPLPALKEIKLKDIENRPIKVCYFFPLPFLPFYVMLSFRSTDTRTHTLQAETYLNKVLLVVNVASNCGFTASNYKDLVELHKRYEGKDFEILAFPCNQFGGQEPGSNEQIKEFTRRYGVEFPVTEKVVMKLFLLLLLSLFLSCRLVFLAIQVSDNSIAIVFLFSSFLSFEKTGLAGGCKRAEHTSFLQVSQGEGAKELLGERCKVELREVSCRQEWQCREQILQHDKPLGHSARH